jgi:hypothetical protein
VSLLGSFGLHGAKISSFYHPLHIYLSPNLCTLFPPHARFTPVLQELGQHYGAPLEDASKRFETDKPLSAVRSAAKALAGKAAARIPPARVHQLRAVILQHFGRETEPWPASLSEQQQLLQVALAVEVKSAAEGWQPHAAVVVAGVLAEGEQLQQQQQGGADYSHGAPASGSCPLAKEQRTSTQHRAQPSTAAAAAAGAGGGP